MLEPLQQYQLIIAMVTGVLGLSISALLAIKEIYFGFFKPRLGIGEISEDEAPIQTRALRKYLKVTIYNRGLAKAENCNATLTLIKHNSTS